MISVKQTSGLKLITLYFGPTPNYAAHLADHANEFNLNRNGNAFDYICTNFGPYNYWIDGQNLSDATHVFMDQWGTGASWALAFGYGPGPTASNDGFYVADEFGWTARFVTPLAGTGELDLSSKKTWDQVKLPYASQYMQIGTAQAWYAMLNFGTLYHSQPELTSYIPEQLISTTPYKQGYATPNARQYIVDMTNQSQMKYAVQLSPGGDNLHLSSILPGWDLAHRGGLPGANLAQWTFSLTGDYTTNITPFTMSGNVLREEFLFDFITDNDWQDAGGNCANVPASAIVSSYKILYQGITQSVNWQFGFMMATAYPLSSPAMCDSVDCDLQSQGSTGGAHIHQRHGSAGIHPHNQEFWRKIFLKSSTPNAAGGTDFGNPAEGWYALDDQYVPTGPKAWCFWDGTRLKFNKISQC